MAGFSPAVGGGQLAVEIVFNIFYSRKKLV